MVDHSSTGIPKPKDWQAFERCTRVLFECILNDRGVQQNGRAGQAQHGIDVYGRPDGKGTHYVGVQCKGKNTDEGEVTEEELRAEVIKTEQFGHPLLEFFLVTTAPVDAKIQEVARTITQEREKTGKPLSVYVLGWAELESRICLHPLALKAFHADATPFSDQIISGIETLVQGQASQNQKLDLLLNQGIRQDTTAKGLDNISFQNETVDTLLHKQIDEYRDLIKNGKPQTALDLLQKLQSNIWKSASPRIKFRLISNRAAALSDLDKEAEAIPLFFEAQKYQPEDKLGLANVALAHLLKGDYKEASKAAFFALEKDPSNADAASYLIQSKIEDETITEPLSLIPAEARDSIQVAFGLIHFYRVRQDSKWIELARDALAKYPDNSHAKRAAAEAEVQAAFATQGLLLGQKPPEPLNLERLGNAAKVLHELWDNYCTSENARKEINLPYNLIQAYRILEDDKSALKVLENAIKRVPTSKELYKLRAIYHLKFGQEKEATDLLEKLTDDAEAVLLLNEIKLRSNPEDALKNLQSFLASRAQGKYRVAAVEFIIDAYLKLKQPEEALKIATAFQAEDPNDLNALIALAYAQQATTDISATRDTLNKARQLIKADTPFNDIFFLCKRYETAGLFNEIADLMRPIVDNKHDSPALIMLLAALINSDRRKEANNLVNSLPKAVSELPAYTRAAMMLHFRRGDYSAAETAAKKYLEKEPNDLRIHLYLADIYFRRDEIKQLQAFFDSDVEKLEGEPEDQMRLAMWMARYNHVERALKLGYELQLKHHDDHQIQASYFGLLLNQNMSQGLNLLVSKIEAHTAFEIANKDNETQIFIIEPDEHLRTAAGFIPTNHPIAEKVNGLKVGDKFKIKDSANGQEWEIKWIKHKYIHALHQNMASYEVKFPEGGALTRVKTHEDGEPPFSSMLDSIKQKHDRSLSILDFYRDNPLPLEIFAEHLGGDVTNVWAGLSASGYSFKACIGNTPERLAAFEAIKLNANTGCVVDALTLHLIKLFNIKDAVTAVCGPISTTESAVDVFRKRRDEMLVHGTQPFMRMYWANGQYYREEVTAEQLQLAQNQIDEELKWIKENIEILPAESDHQFSEDALKIKEALGLSFLNPIMAAKSNNRLLLCEDLSYRQFAIKEAGIRTSWLQPVLMKAREKRKISADVYNQAITQIIAAGHEFTSIDVWVLLFALNQNGEWDKRFEKIAKMLFGKDAEVGSHFRVMIAFFSETWGRRYPTLKVMRATSILLRRYFFGAWQEKYGAHENSKKLEVLVEMFGQENPVFWEYLIGWVKGHFLVSSAPTKAKVIPSKKKKQKR